MYKKNEYMTLCKICNDFFTTPITTLIVNTSGKGSDDRRAGELNENWKRNGRSTINRGGEIGNVVEGGGCASAVRGQMSLGAFIAYVHKIAFRKSLRSSMSKCVASNTIITHHYEKWPDTFAHNILSVRGGLTTFRRTLARMNLQQ